LVHTMKQRSHRNEAIISTSSIRPSSKGEEKSARKKNKSVGRSGIFEENTDRPRPF
jgi:hypothetical protein